MHDARDLKAINLASGGILDFADLKAAPICLKDIALALSRACRFGGQASRFHSVAQHAILVHDLVVEAGHPELALPALHHDSHEAYACDIPAPLKRRMRAARQTVYDGVCDELDDVIAKRFGFTFPTGDSAEGRAVKDADNAALLIEARELISDGGDRILQALKALRVRIEAPDRRLGESLGSLHAAELFEGAHHRLCPD